jgi:hypothetical protein
VSPNNAYADDQNQSHPRAVQNQNAPEEKSVTLRPTTDAQTSIRFRGSKREISFGRILTPTLSSFGEEREKELFCGTFS